jgi:DNA repair exonuclease SbcCD ATPase subunit
MLSKETWELMIEALQAKIQDMKEQSDDLALDLQDRYEELIAIKKDLIDKANEVTDLKYKLRQYEKREDIEHFIKTLGRRYVGLKDNLSWERLFYILYPSADEYEYHKRGKAKQAIINLLRSQDLGFDESGTIFRIH